MVRAEVAVRIASHSDLTSDMRMGVLADPTGERHLYPPSEDMPQMVYVGDEIGESELIEALRAGDIDALARGEVGNLEAVGASNGALAVTALDDAVDCRVADGRGNRRNGRWTAR